jgi:transcriptional regulator with XRE-family HTH domain
MEDIHMGQLLERVIRRKGINISELAAALNITRPTLYSWFNQEVIDETAMQKISSIIVYDFSHDKPKPTVVNKIEEFTPIKDEAYWQERYIQLLERYSKLLEASFLPKRD